MAICLHEYLGDRINDHIVQIFSTDVSEKAISVARKGVYVKSEIAGLSPQRLEKYFEKTNGSFRVGKFIRDLCVFAFSFRQNHDKPRRHRNYLLGSVRLTARVQQRSCLE